MKGHLFLGLAMGQFESMEAGTRMEAGMFSVAKKAALTGYEIFKARVDTAAGSYSGDSDHHEPDGEAIANGITQDLGMETLPDINFNFDSDDAASWTFRLLMKSRGHQ